MKLSVPVTKIFDCDVSKLQQALDETPSEIWDVDNSRQEVFVQHRQTRSILFLWLDNRWLRGAPLDLQTYGYAPEPLTHEVFDIADRVASHFRGRAVKVMLAELQSRGKIPKHTDRLDALTSTHRCHVPIFTNEAVEFSIGDRLHRFNVGSAYEIDNTLPHWVFNGGKAPRVHLIVDVLGTAASQ